MRKSSIAAAVLATTIVAVGCRLDLTEIPAESSETRLSVSLGAEWGHPASMTATFRPGRTPDGAVREIDDETLIVNGVSIPPDSVSEGYRRYTVSGLDLDAPPLHVRPPAVRGVAESPPEIVVSPIWIVAPDTLVAGRPGLLEIRIVGVDADMEGLVDMRWSIKVYPDTGNTDLVSVSGRVPPDSLLSIPTSLLPPDLALGRMIVQGTFFQRYGSAGGAYQFEVQRTFIGAIPFRIEN